MSKDMGGPAFPSPYEFVSRQDAGNIMCTTGITIWDWYAAAALQGLIHLIGNEDLRQHDGHPVNEASIANQAGCFADAMLEQRRKRESGSCE